MKAVLTMCLKEVIVNKLDQAKWDTIMESAGFPASSRILANSDVPDQKFFKLISESAKMMKTNEANLVEIFAEHWICNYTRKVYKPYYFGCKSTKDVLLKMDSIHKKVQSNVSGSHPPSFSYNWQDDKTLIMGYKSQRNMVDYMVAVTKAVGNFYKENITVTKLASDKLKVVFA